MSGTRRLDISLHLDRSQQAAAEAAARADSAKTAKQLIGDAEAVEKAKGKAGTKPATADDVKNQEKISQSQIAGAKAMAAMGASMLGFSSVTGLLHGIVSELDKAAQYAQRTAQEALSLRGSLRELAALRGDLGKTGITAAHVRGVQAQTLQTPEEINQMEQAGLGIGELAIGEKKNGRMEAGKSMTREEFDKAMVSSGKMAKLEGGDPGAYGALTGQIALQSDHELSAEEMEARMNRMFKIQQPGGFKNMSQAASQYARLNPLVMNKLMTGEEAMGTLSAFSVNNPAEAASMTEQFVRATLASRLKDKKVHMNPDQLDVEKSYEYMKKIGADKTSNPVEIGKLIAADFKKQEEAATAKGKKFNAYDYITTKGFGNEQDKLAIMSIAGLRNTGKLEKIEAAQNEALDMGAVDPKTGKREGVTSRRFKERVAGDLNFQNEKAKVVDELADAEKGEKEAPYEVARRTSFAELKKHGDVKGKYEDWKPGSGIYEFGSDMISGAAGSGTYGALNEHTHALLVKEAKRLGIKHDNPTSSFDIESDKELARKIQAKGGNLGGDRNTEKSMAATAASMERSAKMQEEALRRQQEYDRKKQPAPVQGKPNQPATRVP